MGRFAGNKHSRFAQGVRWDRFDYFISTKKSFKLGHFNAVIISDYDVAKEVLQKDALADRPQLYYHRFFMNFKNIGEHIATIMSTIDLYI